MPMIYCFADEYAMSLTNFNNSTVIDGAPVVSKKPKGKKNGKSSKSAHLDGFSVIVAGILNTFE